MCVTELVNAERYTAAFGREVATTYSELRETQGTRFRAGAEAVLQELKEDIHPGIVTSGIREEQQAIIEAVGLDEYVEIIVSAGDEVPVKPEPQPSLEGVAQFDAEPEDASIIGYSLSENIRDAKDIGMTTVWIPPDTQSKDVSELDFVIDSVDELVPVPWQTR